jgi:hypothetical protein
VPAPQNYATVFGRVYDAATNQGLAGVSVSADTALVAVTGSRRFLQHLARPERPDRRASSRRPTAIPSPRSPVAFSVVNGDHVRVDVPLNHG